MTQTIKGKVHLKCILYIIYGTIKSQNIDGIELFTNTNTLTCETLPTVLNICSVTMLDSLDQEL